MCILKIGFMEWNQIMKILYIFPHPDDESFGPARAISSQVRAEHEVYLLTLTRGGATKERFKYGYSIEEMGEVRFNEMNEVAKVLGLTEMIVLDFPDSGLKELDPREIEKDVIRDSKVMEKVGKECAFEIFQENYNPPLEDLFQNIS